ncbi:Hsp70 family protein [Dactylosporangium sp. NPDC050588]|uniref:Hsp70 family protein n=1 Tax=Dactylosporangium sp. NPDC050588 TaxID=3157211 RepID=UPI0034021D7A
MDWLSVDYGTSNTVAVLCRDDGRRQHLLFDSSPLLPSAVYATPDGRILTGRDAERNARVDPSRFEGNPKRRVDETDVLLGDRAHPVGTLIAATLRRVAEEAARVSGGPVGDAIITHPVTWGATRRAILIGAAGQAGLTVRALVPEPVAAAAYFTAVLGHDVDEGRCLLVYDLGAGTFDATVLRRRGDGFHTLASRGLDDVGGLDLDALLVAHVGTAAGPGTPQWRRLLHPADADDRRDFQTLWTDVRQARESLSREASATVHVPRLGRDVIVTREELERDAAPLLRRTVTLATATVEAAGIAPADLAGCLLVGGTSRTPLAATLLHRAIGVAPTAIEDPQLVVAAGAARAPLPAAQEAPEAPQEALEVRQEAPEAPEAPVAAGRAARRRGLVVAAAVLLVAAVAGSVVLRDQFGGPTGPDLVKGSPTRSASATPAQAPTSTPESRTVTGTPPALAAKPVVGAGTLPLTELTLTTLVEGTGEKVARGQTATVNFIAASYTTGVEFDSTWSRNTTFDLVVGTTPVAAGFEAAVQGAAVGSRVQADVPPDLANGAPAGTPPGALRYVIDILAVR